MSVRWPAVVLTARRAFLACGMTGAETPVMDGTLKFPGVILDRAHSYMRSAEAAPAAGTILIDQGEGDGASLKLWRSHEASLRDHGWSCTAVEPWTTWRRGDGPRIHVGLLDSIDWTKTPLFSPGDLGGVVAQRLAWYHGAIGAPYQMTPGVSALAAIRAEFPRGRRAPYWGSGLAPRRGDDPRTGAGDLMWKRPPRRDEVGMGYVHSFDMRAARLAAMGVAELAWDRLEHRQGVVFDETLAGYWGIRAADVPQGRYRIPYVDAGPDGMAYPTTPVMKSLMRKGVNPDVMDAWVATGVRFLKGVASRWNAARLDAMAGEPEPVQRAVAATYREGAAMLARAGGSIYRADWYHTIMDRQRMTVFGHVDRIERDHDRYPLMIHTDRLWYASTVSDGRQAAEELRIKIGQGLGQFRVQSSATSAEFFKVRG